jgi:glucose-6-phosphate isomerase
MMREVVAAKKTPNLKYIIVVGIGGSNLRTYAIYNALMKECDAFVNTRFPKMLFADTISASLMKTIERVLKEEVRDSSEICVNIISKSGSTTETIASFEVLCSALRTYLKSHRTSKATSLACRLKFENFGCPPAPHSRKRSGGQNPKFSNLQLDMRFEIGSERALPRD